MTDLPTKQTLDDIERIGIEFSSEFLTIKTMLRQSIDRTTMFIITDRKVNDDGTISYVWSQNMNVLYSAAEKQATIKYYEALIKCYDEFCNNETNSDGTIYDLFNARPRIDKVIATLADEGII